MLCMPKIPLCGGLIIGVDNIEPNTPPLVMVNVPPVISSMEICPSLARKAKRFTSLSTPLKDKFSAFLITGTINPLGPETAIEISWKSCFIW